MVVDWLELLTILDSTEELVVVNCEDTALLEFGGLEPPPPPPQPTNVITLANNKLWNNGAFLTIAMTVITPFPLMRIYLSEVKMARIMTGFTLHMCDRNSINLVK